MTSINLPTYKITQLRCKPLFTSYRVVSSKILQSHVLQSLVLNKTKFKGFNDKEYDLRELLCTVMPNVKLQYRHPLILVHLY